MSETPGFAAPLPPASSRWSAARAKPKWTPRSVKLADRSRDCRGASGAVAGAVVDGRASTPRPAKLMFNYFGPFWSSAHISRKMRS